MDEKECINIFEKYLDKSAICSQAILDKRKEQMNRCVEWMMLQLNEPVHPAGSIEDLPKEFSMFGQSAYNLVRECVIRRDDNRCRICGSPAFNVHHIRPRQFKGKDHPRNLIALCKQCHAEAHVIIDTEIMESFIKAIYRGNMYRDNMKKIAEKYNLSMELME